MNASIVLGNDTTGKAVHVDIEELLATRLLVQGNSGSGKSYLLRRLLEESAPMVQQVIIDPEGDFVTFAEPYGHIVVDGSAYAGTELLRLAARVREHRASVVLALDGLEVEAQMRCAAQFISALFDAPREQWYPALVVVDEAQLFAPAAAGDVSDEVRRMSLSAMTNLMCRGRKRGLAGVIATQRIAKLAKNVAAEASNFLMGRTFLDIDMLRAADLLGMERRQAEQIRDLDRGCFLALGPALTRRPLAVRVAEVKTSARAVTPGLMPRPSASPEELQALLHEDLGSEEVAAPSVRAIAPRAEPEELFQKIETFESFTVNEDVSGVGLQPVDDIEPVIADILAGMAEEEGCTFQAPGTLYQDFTVRCRMRRVSSSGIDAIQFRRRFAVALAGIPHGASESEGPWQELLQLSKGVAEDLLAPFLVIAKAAVQEEPCPDDDYLAVMYGTRSQGRIRRLLEHLEKTGLIVVRTDFSGRRSITIPQLGVTTASA